MTNYNAYLSRDFGETLNKIKTKEQYLKVRNQWKADYKAISAEIRALKTMIRNRLRAGMYAGNQQSELASKRIWANTIMECLPLLKEKARENYEKSKLAHAAE